MDHECRASENPRFDAVFKSMDERRNTIIGETDGQGFTKKTPDACSPMGWLAKLLDNSRSYGDGMTQLQKKVEEMEASLAQHEAYEDQLDSFATKVASCWEHCQSTLGFTDEEATEASQSVKTHTGKP